MGCIGELFDSLGRREDEAPLLPCREDEQRRERGEEPARRHMDLRDGALMLHLAEGRCGPERNLRLQPATARTEELAPMLQVYGFERVAVAFGDLFFIDPRPG